MKSRKRSTLMALAIAAATFGSVPAANADSVYFSPSGTVGPVGEFLDTAAPGDTFSLDILGVFDNPLYGGTMSLQFDAAGLLINSGSVDSSVWDFSNNGGAAGAPGEWNNIAFDVFFNDPQGGSATPFVLATINLTALTSGTWSLQISDSFFAGFEPPPFSPTLYGAGIEVSSVSVVPVPPAALLLFSGITGLVAIARRRHAGR